MADNLCEGLDSKESGKDEQDWGYEEGVEWGLHFPAANGEYQSPINLNSREAQYDPSLLDVGLSPNYVVCRDCEVINDGHTVSIILKSKSVVTGGPLPSAHEFELHEVRFHWGKENQRGSEHTVNFKAFPMELHLIHWNSTLFNSLEDALGKRNGVLIIALFVQLRNVYHKSKGTMTEPWGTPQVKAATEEEALAMLAEKVLFYFSAHENILSVLCLNQIGKEHLGLKAITEVLQDLQYKGKNKIIPCFNPNTLLPDPLLRDYWVYEGSLSTPPCSEKVTWILYRYPLTISQLQIEEFRRLRSHVKGAELNEGNDGLLGDNFRPTQPLTDRVVRAAFQ